MKFVYEAVLEIDDDKAVRLASEAVGTVIGEATKKIEENGKRVEIPKEFYKLVLFKLAKRYGIEIACL